MLHVPVSWPALWQTYLKVIFIVKVVNLVTQYKRRCLTLSCAHKDTCGDNKEDKEILRRPSDRRIHLY